MSNKQETIEIRGARVHNLKNIDIEFPRNRMIVLTGVSGSGKSSLAFDTLYAEGQRRYVESLSSYARQFLGRMNRPDVDFISGIPPAIAIEQRVNSRNPRSTVGTSTEIYEYLRLLFARIGKTYSPVSGREVKRDTPDSVVSFINSHPIGTRAIILTPVAIPENINVKEFLTFLNKQGFERIEVEDSIIRCDEKEAEEILSGKSEVNVVVDRITATSDNSEASRIADSVETAFQSGKDVCFVLTENSGTYSRHRFSNSFDIDGIHFEEPTEHLFSFNNPLGACPLCEGYGKIIGIDEDLVIPNKSLSVYEDAIACWKGDSLKRWKERLIKNASIFDFPVHKPWHLLSDEQRRLVWTGNRYFFGLNRFFSHLEEKKYKIQYRVLLSRYRGKTTCTECSGTRLRREAGYVKVGGKPIYDLTGMSIDTLNQFFNNFKPKGSDSVIADRILAEIRQRVKFLLDVGLPYLTLERTSSTLSGGESQRINLATSLGSSLVGSLYILDEPSIGLHPRDTSLLIDVLRELRDIGNTVVVVEHDEDIIRAADEIADLGPYAGRLGGEIVFHGSPDKAEKGESLTAMYLSGRMNIPVPERRRKWNSYIEIRGARENNLKDLNVKIPLYVMTCVTGVSGSGKSTLVNDILYRALNKNITGASNPRPGEFESLGGDYNRITSVEMVDQNPIGRSSRSNPVTYLKAYDEIRKIFSQQQASVQQKFSASYFSFNVPGGRCEECKGEGIIKVEMQFMADVELTCEVCKGLRFKREVLEVKYRGKSILDILEMTVDEAIEFFNRPEEKQSVRIADKLRPLADVGLGYIRLGQSSSTFSGGESQRLKLAYFISHERSNEHILFIFDEPTTGLHFHDIGKLLQSMQSLISGGHSVLLIEHNIEIIKSSDWIIDLGPGGGREGGTLIFEGTPENIINCNDSYTGRYLRKAILP